jgi:hypothetical protein
MVNRRTATGGRGKGSCGKNQWHDAWALAWPGCIASVAPSQLDIPARSAVCPQSRPCHRSLPTSVERCSTGAARLRALRRREDQYPGQTAQTSFITTSPGRPIYVEHEYARAGALAYLAAWDVQRALLFGRCERKNGIAAFEHLIVQIMRRQPYRLARRVFPIADNGSSIVVSQRPTASAPSGPILFWSIRRSTPVGSTRSRSTFLSSSANSLRRATLPTGPTLNGACWPSRRAISGLQGHSSGPLLAVTFTYSSPSSCQAGRPGTNQGRQIRHRNCESQYLVLARLYRKMLGISG